MFWYNLDSCWPWLFRWSCLHCINVLKSYFEGLNCNQPLSYCLNSLLSKILTSERRHWEVESAALRLLWQPFIFIYASSFTFLSGSHIFCLVWHWLWFLSRARSRCAEMPIERRRGRIMSLNSPSLSHTVFGQSAPLNCHWLIFLFAKSETTLVETGHNKVIPGLLSAANWRDSPLEQPRYAHFRCVKKKWRLFSPSCYQQW